MNERDTVTGRKRLAILGAVLAVGGVVLAGCNSEPYEPSKLEQPSKSEKEAKPDSSPSSSEDEKAAINAIKAWIDASNESRKTLDPAPMLELSGPDCMTCDYRADELEKMKKAGQHYEGDFEEVFIAAEPVKGDPSHFIVTKSVGDARIVDESGALQSQTPASEHKSDFEMKQQEGKWIVVGVLGVDRE